MSLVSISSANIGLCKNNKWSAMAGVGSIWWKCSDQWEFQQKISLTLFLLQVLRSLTQKQRSWWLLRRSHNILQTKKTFMNNLFFGLLQRQVSAGFHFYYFSKLQCNCIFLSQKPTPTASTCIAENVSSDFYSPQPGWVQCLLFDCI